MRLRHKPETNDGSEYPSGQSPSVLWPLGQIFARKIKPGARVAVNNTTFKLKGHGTVLETSTDTSRGFGTKMYPSYRVRLDDGQEEWLGSYCFNVLKH